jgi:hypothetical protein
MRRGGRTRAVSRSRRAWNFSFDLASVAFLLGCFGSFGSSAQRFLSAQRLDSFRFDACGFCSSSFLSGLRLRTRLFGGGGNSSLLFGGSLDVCSLTAAADRFSGGRRLRSRRRFGRGSGRAATTRRRCRSILLLGACSLLALPAGANAGDLVVREHAHVAANGNVH